MADYNNPGNVNIEAAVNSIIGNGGGISERINTDGSTHVTAYSRDENRHLSYDTKDGKYYNVHTDKDNRGYTQYGGGY
jgi:hypothetical protein